MLCTFMLYRACRRCVSSGDQEAATPRLGGNLCKILKDMKIKRFKRLFHNTAFHLRDRIVQFSLLCRNDQGWIRNRTTWHYAASLVAVDPESNNFSKNQARAQMRRLSHTTWISSSESTRMSRRVSAFEKKGSGATSLNLGRAWESGKRCWEDCLMCARCCPSGRRLESTTVCPEHKLQEGFTWRREIWKHRNITTVHVEESPWEEEAEEEHSPREVSVRKTLHLYAEAIDFKTTLAEGPGWIWFQEWPGKDPRC